MESHQLLSQSNASGQNAMHATTEYPNLLSAIESADMKTPQLMRIVLTQGGIFLFLFYLIFWNARVLGMLITVCANHLFLPRGYYLHIGSLSIWFLTGRVLFRDLRYVTLDYSVEVQDGDLRLRWWLAFHPGQDGGRDGQEWGRLSLLARVKRFCCKGAVETQTAEEPLAGRRAAKSDGHGKNRKGEGHEKGKKKGRLEVTLNGCELHIYNRSELYTRLFKQFGLEDRNWPQKHPGSGLHSSAFDKESNSSLDAIHEYPFSHFLLFFDSFLDLLIEK